MYTLSFQGHKGWAALLGLAAAIVGIATPYAAIMPPKVQAVVGVAGALVAALSHPPGAAAQSTVTVSAAPGAPTAS